MSRDIKELVKGILAGEIKTDSLSKEEFDNVNAVMDLIKAKILTPEEQKKNREKAIKAGNEAAFRAANINVPKKKEPQEKKEPRKVGHLTVIKEEDGMEKKGQEIVDYSSGGQWKISKGEKLEKPPVSEAQRKAMRAAAAGRSNLDIPKSVGEDFSESDPGGKLPEKVEKAIKPGPTLDYGKINPEQNPLSNPEAAKEARTARYADAEAKAATIDYKNNPVAKPQYYKGAADRAKATRAKLEAESQETAAETIARRQKMNKEEGTNEEREPSTAERSRMTAKSEKEPHKDDPAHEKKEQKKAQKIKEEAEDILDMHKAEECYKMSDRGQWSIEKK